MANKASEWLFVIGVIMSVWSTFLFDHDNVIFSKEVRTVGLMMPLYLLIAFACVSLGIIGYRVATFNDCINAASELKQQLKEARKDLERRGFKFDL